LSICRKRSYERFCTSIRFGIWMVVGIFEKLRRLRNAYLLLFGITTPEGPLKAPGTPGGWSIPFAHAGRHYLRHRHANEKINVRSRCFTAGPSGSRTLQVQQRALIIRATLTPVTESSAAITGF